MVLWYGFLPLGVERYMEDGDLWEAPEGDWYVREKSRWELYSPDNT